MCFANPGTSEMHFVAALDEVPEMLGVLCLFEGVVTGAAEGYARMAGKPAATLLHLGPGMGNGLANLHNARRGHTPLVNVIGDHETYHKQYDAPLESDIEPLADWIHGFTRRISGGATIAAATGATPLVETFPSRHTRGEGVPVMDKLGYLAEAAQAQLEGAKHLIVAGTGAPVSFFAYPGKPSSVVPEGVQVHTLADLVAPDTEPRPGARGRPGAAVGSAGRGELGAGDRCAAPGERRHLRRDQHLGAAAARGDGRLTPARYPDIDRWRHRPGSAGGGRCGRRRTGPAAIVALQADGSAAYTISALWTMARENLNVTVVLLNNHATRSCGWNSPAPGRERADPRPRDCWIWPTLLWTSPRSPRDSGCRQPSPPPAGNWRNSSRPPSWTRGRI
ncbi:acetolactate synthase-1/2/3 large subunit [Gordonia hydrophobica]|nr:acetolactate synthase-1/2/3 large subunit [Gordonia hydrophobica]